MSFISLHSILSQSEVNGPGERLVIWVQGCSKGCVGCFNPGTWKSSKKWLETPERLAEYVISSNPEGLTLTGGDPLEQSDSLLEFLKALHKGVPSSLRADFLPRGIICFTGYRLDELHGSALECVDYCDLLIDGRYVKELHYTNGLAGSSNQEFHFSSHPGRGEARIKREEILIDHSIEVHVDVNDASVIRVTGFPHVDRKFLKNLGLSIDDSSDKSDLGI